MWGSLARGITATVRETANSAASGDLDGALRGTANVLRRVGEVVAPPLPDNDDDDDEYLDDEEEYYDEDDAGSYYEEEEDDGVEFEGEADVATVGEEEKESPNLDRYRQKQTGQTSYGENETINNYTDLENVTESAFTRP